MSRHNSTARWSWLLVRQGAARPLATLGVFALLLAVSLFSVRTLYIDSDMLALLPQDGEEVNQFRTTITRFGSADVLLAAIELGEDGVSDANLDYADMLVDAFGESIFLDPVTARAEDFRDDALGLLASVTLFLNEDELKAFVDKFQQEQVQIAAERLKNALASPMDMAYKELLQQDPLDVLSLFSKRNLLKQFGPRMEQGGYWTDDHGQLLLIPLKPKGAAADLPFSRALMEDLNRLRAETNVSFSELYDGQAAPEVLFAGGYPIAAAEGALVLQDMTRGLLFSALTVIALFTFAFGRFRALMISGVPLLLGLALTFGFLSIAPGHLNSATSAFAALLIGLGVDFIIVLYGRYLEARELGYTHARALAAMNHTRVSGVLLGAATTAITFFAFLFSSFPALSELGLITGVGILLLVVTVLTVLPALLTLLERHRKPRGSFPRAPGISKLTTLASSWPKTTLTLALLLTLASSLTVSRVVYDDDVRNMRSPQNPGVVAQQRIMDVFDMRFTPLMVRVDGQSQEEVLKHIHELAPKLSVLADGERLVSVDAPLTHFPTREKQLVNLQYLEANCIDTALFREAFSDALSQRGLRPEPFLESIDPLLKALNLEDPKQPADLAKGKLSLLLDRYLAHDGAGYSGMIYCYTPKDKWHTELPPGLKEIVNLDANAHLTGPVVVSMELKRTVWHDARLGMLLGTLVVVLLMMIDLGSVRAGLLAIGPLAMGMLWTLGAMGYLNLPVNFTNIFVFTMIIGIGVDYGIHQVHCYLQGGSLGGVSKAIAIAAVTTVLGFGSLAFSHYPGLQSLGKVAIIGTLFTALISVTVLPATFKLFPISQPIRELKEESEGDEGGTHLIRCDQSG